MTGMTLIFSKDRPMQLDACINSCKMYYPWYNIIVLYRYTNEAHREGYELCEKYHDDVDFIEEKYFKHQTEYLLRMFDRVTFLCDDDIFFKRTHHPHIFSGETISHRLGDNTVNKRHESYTVSMDGNIYSAQDLLPLLEIIEYENPNQLESKMVPHHNKFDMSLPGQYLVNFAHNRVSESSGCRFSGDYDTDYLTYLFLEGNRIDILSLDYGNITSPHVYDREFVFIENIN